MELSKLGASSINFLRVELRIKAGSVDVSSL